MAGSNLGMTIASFHNVRVGRGMIYIPAYQVGENTINSCCKFSGFVNDKRGHDHVYNFVSWGKLADRCAKANSPGKELNLICEVNSYEGRIFNDDRQPMLKADGTPRTTLKTSFVIQNIVFGQESEKQIQAEILAGQRNPNWNVPGEGRETWKQMLALRKPYLDAPYDGTSPMYGFARVIHKANQAGQVATGQATAAPADGAPATPAGGVNPFVTAPAGGNPQVMNAGTGEEVPY